jgi:predicted nucleic acid-binding protein
MLTHVLDTSAWLAHMFHEPGADEVTELFDKWDNQIGVSVASLVEVYGRLRSGNRESEFGWLVEYYRDLFDAFIPITESIALRAIQLRAASSGRLPAIDSLIAATASLEGATLVHRDPHFTNVPADLLEQLALPTG